MEQSVDSVFVLLKQGALQMGIELSDEQVVLLATHLQELKQWQTRCNLTALVTDEDIAVKHFLDSLSCLQVIDHEPASLIDIGPGAGFPSIPLRIALPNLSCTLVEATQKKARFLSHIIAKLSLSKVSVVNDRAESPSMKPCHASFDMATGRAVAGMSTTIEYTLPFLKLGGRLIIQKGPRLDELATIQQALSLLGGGIQQVHKVILPFQHHTRHLVVIEKIATTPECYPRRVGIPQKRPL